MFAYYAKWIERFADKVRPLAKAHKFPLAGDLLAAFELLKTELEPVALNSLDESVPFVVECDASDVAISATLNQRGCPVAFMSPTLHGSELHYLACEKEATATIKAIRKWSHLLSRRIFTFITDQRSVAFMLDSRRRFKIKTDKIQQWRVELATFSYKVKCRPGQQNVALDTLMRAYCSTVSAACSLEELHRDLCHPGITRLLHFVRTKNLPYSTTDVRKVVSNCKTCAEVKLRCYRRGSATLIKASRPMERISLDFKGRLPSTSGNSYLLIAIDEYSRFPFAFPCKDMTAPTVICCLDKLFALCGTAGFVHSNNGSAFVSGDFKRYLLRRGIASSSSNIYHLAGNGQAKKTVGTIWKAVQLALKNHELPLSRWEVVLEDVLHSVRSLLCTDTNTTPPESFFNFQRRSGSGESLPSWLTDSRKAYLKRFARSSKNEPLVEEVELVNVNPMFARARYPGGREVSVNLGPCFGDVALRPLPEQCSLSESLDVNREDVESDSASRINRDVCTDDPQSDSPVNEGDLFTEPEFIPRRSGRSNKGYHRCVMYLHDYYAVCHTYSHVLLCFMPRAYCIFLPLAVAFSFRLSRSFKL